MEIAKPAVNPEEMHKVCRQVAERSAHILSEFAQRHVANSVSAAVSDELGIAKAYMDLYARMFSNPLALASASTNMMFDYMQLWQSSWLKLFGVESRPVAQPARSDSRFKDSDWDSNFLFDFIKQSYLIASRHIQHAVANVDGLPEESQKKVAFFTRQYVDALAPSNFVLTNPQVLRETVASGGQNLLKGLNNLLSDVEKGEGQLRISMTDEAAFQLGKNVATTPGKVVFQTDLMQLIQYQPATAEVYRRPLIIMPPWINKYYILDLREKNSFIKWAVDQGHTVFVISWVNPDARLAQKGFEDYLLEGSLAALDAVERATGENKVNFIGYCLGGTLLGCTLSHLAAKGDDRVAAATFFVSLLDFSAPGELGVFIDEQQVQNLEKKMNERGYLEGSEMAGTFNLLRANDLVWSFVINNYLLGKDPFPFDLLYWNSDSTRMPAKMHSFYLRNMYMKNLLGVPGGITLAGEPVDLSKVRIPAYFISTVEDHIAPWMTTYRGARYLGGKVRFVLGGSGHIAGIVNPPAAKKYHFWTNAALPESPDEWFEGADQHPGSWWVDWQAWIDSRNADAKGASKVPARTPGDGKLKVLEDAPGSYATLRLSAKKPVA
ncbi:MAG: class I poly(R)-hydroxyalkanoic acid synthase [Betaproteobacteria bacterium RIFCSPLOWO2_02_FULL_66_14]|nr:MAG: class I poly(R)-hydroxyalkanoic acid synthase [Betaproteobacteria bacterium RIFCSPLOWO2_02_FULL_66_14]